MMAPIRVGIIGLSSTPADVSAGSAGSWAAMAHLPYLLASPSYTITALCNSSVKSAQTAVRIHNLPSTTKTYGSPEDLANDPDVDLVVVAVRVDRHYEVALPALQAGKNVFVEWPLASNFQQAKEMLAVAEKSGSKTIVGLQARASPYVQETKRLVEEKAIGEVLSSHLTCETGFPGDADLPGVDYFIKPEVGANMFTILFSHVADPVFYTLGGLGEVSALLTTRWPQIKLLNSDGSFNKMAKRETPDHVMVQGTLANNAAPVSIFVRSDKAFKNTPPFTWRIFGTTGEIRLTAMAGLNIALSGAKLELYSHEKDTVQTIDVKFPEGVQGLNPFATNIGQLYELFAKGGTVKEGFVDFEQAVGMHEALLKMEKSSKGKKDERVGAQIRDLDQHN
ncbi:NAD-P-binding protein, partial [Paraphoma chrysanthemicola]